MEIWTPQSIINKEIKITPDYNYNYNVMPISGAVLRRRSISPSAISAYDAIVLATSNLTHYWPLSETTGTVVYDKVISGAVNGFNNSVTIDQTSIMPTCPDPCYHFNGQGSDVRMVNCLIDESVDWSIECWLNLDSTVLSTFSFPMWLTDNGSLGFGLQGDGTTLDLQQNANSRVIGPVVNAATTYHFVVTCHATTMTFFLNGTSLIKTITTKDNPSTSTGATRFGTFSTGGGGVGGAVLKMQKVAFYNTALSGATVSAHYGAG